MHIAAGGYKASPSLLNELVLVRNNCNRANVASTGHAVAIHYNMANAAAGGPKQPVLVENFFLKN